MDVSKYTKLIRKVVFKVAGRQVCKEDIEDLVCDIQVNLLADKLKRYDPSKGIELTGFICMVAHREAVDYIRSKRESVTDTGTMPDGVSHQADALSLLIKREQKTRLRQAITTLTAAEQELAQAICDDDFDIEAFAAKRGITPNAVYVARHRMITKLRKILKTGSA